ncbi:MAG: GNAT family N-acetyltransferase [Oscillospiraceae bacterium]|nr:GNAT family N-acetyltransferase [Oscillospiraceae bacterium]
MSDIIYKDTKDFNAQELQDLFLSVEWSSGHFPDKLVIAMKNSDSVFTAWENNKLVGLINVLDDGVMTAYIHYMLVNPEYQGQGIGKKLICFVKEKYKDYLRICLTAYKHAVGFYESCGFKTSESKPMNITSLLI